MKDTKIVVLLKTLSKKELKSFSKFVYSPYFNENETLCLLFNCLARLHPHFVENKTKKEKIFKQLFPKEAFNDLKLRRLNSQLFKLAETFVAHEFLDNKQEHLDSSIVSFYVNRNLEKHFKARINSNKNKVDNEYEENGVYYYYQLQKASVSIRYFLSKNERGSEINQLLAKMGNYLDSYYLISKLSYCCSVVNNQKELKFEASIPFFKEILKGLENSDYLKIPLIAFYYTVLRMLTEGKECYFKELRKLLTNQVAYFPDLAWAEMMYAYAKNYCMTHISNGNMIYFNELFDLYKEEISYFIVAKKQKISAAKFKNIITTGLRLQKFDWVENFIQEHQDKIESAYTEDIIKYNLAHLYFYQKKYNDAISLLFQSGFKDIFYKVDSRKLLLQIYHELDEMDARDSLINSLRVFIHSKKDLLSELHIDRVRNFLNILTAITKVTPRDKAAIEKIKQDLADTKVLIERDWLVEKVGELR